MSSTPSQEDVDHTLDSDVEENTDDNPKATRNTEPTLPRTAMPPCQEKTLNASDISLLRSAIVELTNRLSHEGASPPSVKEKGKGPAKRPHKEAGNFPAQKRRHVGSTSTTTKTDDSPVAEELDHDELMNQVLNENPSGSGIYDGGNESDDSNEEDTLLELLEKEYESDDVVGEKLQHSQFAKLLDKMFRHRMSDTALKEKLDHQVRPENCANAKPTRVNPGIWRKLRDFTKKRDSNIYKIQQALIKGIIPVAKMTDLSMTGHVSKEQLQEIKSMGLQALSLLTHANYELNMQRKQLMKADIGKEYASLCYSHIPFTDMLFGDDLQKQLKDIGDVNKIGAKLQSKSQANANAYSQASSYKYPQKAPKNFRGQGFKPWKKKAHQNYQKQKQHQQTK